MQQITAEQAVEHWQSEYREWSPNLSGLSPGDVRIWDATVHWSIIRLAAEAHRVEPTLGAWACMVEAHEVARVIGVRRDTVLRHWRRICERKPELMHREHRGARACIRWPRLVAAARVDQEQREELDKWCKEAGRQEPGLHINVNRNWSQSGKFNVTCYLMDVESREAVQVVVDRLLMAMSTMGVVYGASARAEAEKQSLPTTHPSVLKQVGEAIMDATEALDAMAERSHADAV